MLRRPARLLSSVLALLLPLFAACSSSSGDATPGAPPTAAPADPDGQLLEGEDGDPALDALISLTPSAVAPADIQGGLLTTRLEAQLRADATVAEVNQALEANDAAIVSMVAGFPACTLVVPPAADVAAAEARASALLATGAFVAVTPSFTAMDATEALPVSALLGVGADPLGEARVRAAWNAQGVIGVGAVPLPVIVPDLYATLDPLPTITAQYFVDGPGVEAVGVAGNEGFTAAGIIGYDTFDPDGIEAVHPRASTELDIASVSLGGLTWLERIQVTADTLQDVPARAVLHTGSTYEPEASYRTKGWRVTDALYWRYLTRDIEALAFVHAQAAGDHGFDGGELAQARWCSPYALSESVADPTAGLTGADAEQAAQALLALGEVFAPRGNLRVVGSSTNELAESDFSSPGVDLRTIGEFLLAPCLVPSGNCLDGETETFSTSAASAQVAGIYSYLWTLKPELTRTELLNLVDNAYFAGWKPGVVDAYQAVLALDPNLFAASVRREILDVAAGANTFDPVGDGTFDEHDLRVFLDSFATANLSQTRFDLNGDGFVGLDFTAPMDLDVNIPPMLTEVSTFFGESEMTYDENAVTDAEVLCYYAFTSLYEGDEQARNELLADCIGVFPRVEEFGATLANYVSSGSLDDDDSAVLSGEGEMEVAAQVGQAQSDGSAEVDLPGGLQMPEEIRFSGSIFAIVGDDDDDSLTAEIGASMDFYLVIPEGPSRFVDLFYTVNADFTGDLDPNGPHRGVDFFFEVAPVSGASQDPLFLADFAVDETSSQKFINESDQTILLLPPGEYSVSFRTSAYQRAVPTDQANLSADSFWSVVIEILES